MLVCDVLEEAVQSTDFCSIRLFCTARNIFELYGAVVPTHHQKLLETIPQQVGEFHANATKINTAVLFGFGVWLAQNRVSVEFVMYCG